MVGKGKSHKVSSAPSSYSIGGSSAYVPTGGSVSVLGEIGSQMPTLMTTGTSSPSKSPKHTKWPKGKNGKDDGIVGPTISPVPTAYDSPVPPTAPVSEPSDDTSSEPSVTDSPVSSPPGTPQTDEPIASPGSKPTVTPTTKPSPSSPGVDPTPDPTPALTKEPSKSPTKSPTLSPNGGDPTSGDPTLAPTSKPTTGTPTNDPTLPPVSTTTDPPTSKPTKSPTNDPTLPPVSTTTDPPTSKPTTVAPTDAPTTAPTIAPTIDPTTAPTKVPTKSPTENPTSSPTTSPTDDPTTTPTENVNSGEVVPDGQVVIIDGFKNGVANLCATSSLGSEINLSDLIDETFSFNYQIEYFEESTLSTLMNAVELKIHSLLVNGALECSGTSPQRHRHLQGVSVLTIGYNKTESPLAGISTLPVDSVSSKRSCASTTGGEDCTVVDAAYTLMLMKMTKTEEVSQVKTEQWEFLKKEELNGQFEDIHANITRFILLDPLESPQNEEPRPGEQTILPEKMKSESKRNYTWSWVLGMLAISAVIVALVVYRRSRKKTVEESPLEDDDSTRAGNDIYVNDPFVSDNDTSRAVSRENI